MWSASVNSCEMLVSRILKTAFVLQTEVYLTAAQRENKRDSVSSAHTDTNTNAAASPTENDQAQEMRWMAPECICDAEYTHKSDVWAMGVVFYEVHFGLFAVTFCALFITILNR
jgi:hypothetical protein